MKDGIRQAAFELGFDLCGFTSAEPPSSAQHFRSWIDAGQHGTMGWLARNPERRTHLDTVLPGARSVVCLAVVYGTRRSDETASCRVVDGGDPNETIPPRAFGGSRELLPLQNQRPAIRAPNEFNRPTAVSASLTRGVVARYARHQDYHNVLAEPLKTLAALIGERAGPGTRSLCYVDTGPILERDLAQRAGLGFIGKHTNLVSRKLGNWILLAEIITTAAIEPDAPERNRCGSCARCMEACPTRAITAPFQLDARRCISYLTIELKDSIPIELRPAIGDRIFGCDDCLAVCPWNRFAVEGRLMKLAARDDLHGPELLDLLRLDDAGFKARFAGTPILRSKRRGFLRNVCVALGNTAGPEALFALEHAAHDSEPLIAEHARWAIDAIVRRTPSRTEKE